MNRNDLDKRLRDLGKFTYKREVFGTDTSAEIEKTVAEIKELKENLDIVNAHIDSIKNQRKCPNCDAKLPRNSVFCNICGAKLTEEEPESEVEAEVVEEPVEAVVEAAEEAAE